MRFAVLTSLALTVPLSVSGLAYAQPGQTYSLEKEIKFRGVPVVMRYQNRPGGTVPNVISGLQVDKLAAGLGHITAIAYAPDGAIIVADSEKNRVTRLEDRGLDGRMDARRIIAEGLESLSGLAVIGDTLYLVDQQAVWQVPVSGGPRTEFVSLRRTEAHPDNRPLLADADNNRLLLGLNVGADAKVIGIDIETGTASLITTGTGKITALAKPKKGAIWAGFEDAIVPVIEGQSLSVDRGQKLEPGVEIPAILVPGQYEGFDGWPEQMTDNVLAAQVSTTRLPSGTSGGFNVVALPTVFGQPQAEIAVLVDGFLARSGRTAWGYPAALAMDARGLLIADPKSGTLWRVGKALPKPVIIKAAPPTAKPEPEPEKVAKSKPTMGSHIETASTLESGSTLTLGSTIVRDYEAREKEKEAAEKARKGEPD